MNEQVKKLNECWTDIYFHLHYTHNEKISHQAIRILQLIDKQEGMGIKEIASYIQVSQNTASEHVKRMIEKNYMLKKRDPEDERKVILQLTSVGEDVLHRNTCLDEEKLESLFNQSNEDEKAIIVAGLTLLSERAKQCM